MTTDPRSMNRAELEAMTRHFLAKGGAIARCPPGSSGNIVYKRQTFQRRSEPVNNKAGTTLAVKAAPGR